MTDPVDKLVRMANQIASFFGSYPPEEGRAGVRDHIEAFWTPRMRAVLDAHVAKTGGTGLDPLAIAALSRSPRAESPIAKGTAGPEDAGQLASDAG